MIKLWLVLSLFTIGCATLSPKEDWEGGFVQADYQYKYFVGNGVRPKEDDACNEAKTSAITQLLTNEFSFNSSVAFGSIESTTATVAQRKYNNSLTDLDLSNFTLEKQKIRFIGKEIISYQCVRLYKITLTELDRIKQIAKQKSESTESQENIELLNKQLEKDLTSKVAKAEADKAAALHEKLNYKNKYPDLTLEAGLGIRKVMAQSFMVGNIGFRVRAFNHIYFGLETIRGAVVSKYSAMSTTPEGQSTEITRCKNCDFDDSMVSNGGSISYYPAYNGRDGGMYSKMSLMSDEYKKYCEYTDGVCTKKISNNIYRGRSLNLEVGLYSQHFSVGLVLGKNIDPNSILTDMGLLKVLWIIPALN
jgi:hypothetical protein